jgi:hypothetical protein
MKLKKTIINGMEIFRVKKDVVGSEEIQKSAKEALKIKPLKTWKNELKKQKANLVLMNDEGLAYQATTFVHKKNIYAGIAPNLVQAYFDLAFEQIQYTDKYADTFHYISEIKFDEIKLVNPNIFHRFIQYRISSIIFLHLSVEAFINYIIPEDFVYIKTEESKSNKFQTQKTEYNKEHIERWITTKEKIEKVLPEIPKINFEASKNGTIIGRILEIAKIRDEIVHLKSKDKESSMYYSKIFDFIASRDLLEYLHSVKKFINILEKDFLKIVSIKEDNSNNEILIEKEEYLNIGVFFQITKIKKERIILKIKKWKGLTKDDEKLKAVLGHLTLMDDMNIIDDYLINEESKYFVIEIFKTKEQIK